MPILKMNGKKGSWEPQIRKIPVDTMDHLIQFYGDAGKPGNFCIK